MISIDASTNVHLPADVVFEFVSDLTNNRLWLPWVLNTVKMSSGPTAVGSTYRQTTSFYLGRRLTAALRVTAYEPNRSISFKPIEGPFRQTIAYSVQPAERGCRFACRVTTDFIGPFRLLEPLVSVTLTRRVRGYMRHEVAALKRLLESEATRGHLPALSGTMLA